MAELLGIERLFADGYHNAFTDLVCWGDHYYLCFRKAQTHSITPAGDVLIYRSSDLETWDLCARFDTGGDDRDPKLIDAGERLGVVFGTWFPRWGDGTRSIRGAEHDLVTHVSVSRDGTTWSTPRQAYVINYWIWRILAAEDGYYGAAYHFGARDDGDLYGLHLLHSEDLFEWRYRGLIRGGGGASEAALYQPEPGSIHCVVRALEPRHHSWIGHSRAPYADWSWADLGVMVHAPAILEVDGQWITAGRSQEEDLPEGSYVEYEAPRPHHTSVWAIVGTRAEHVLTVPSGGDCSYPGLALGPDGEVLMSYYSQHEWLPLAADPPTPDDVFLARFRL